MQPMPQQETLTERAELAEVKYSVEAMSEGPMDPSAMGVSIAMQSCAACASCSA